MPVTKSLLAALSLALVVLNSCTKGEIQPNNNALIGTWVVTAIQSDRPYDWDADGYAETDIFHTYSYCQQDIQLVFESGGYGESRQGCNSAWENMDWQLGNNQLSMQMYSDAIHLYLTQFDENTIRGYDQVNVNGSSYNITYTLRKRY